MKDDLRCRLDRRIAEASHRKALREIQSNQSMDPANKPVFYTDKAAKAEIAKRDERIAELESQLEQQKKASSSVATPSAPKPNSTIPKKPERELTGLDKAIAAHKGEAINPAAGEEGGPEATGLQRAIEAHKKTKR